MRVHCIPTWERSTKNTIKWKKSRHCFRENIFFRWARRCNGCSVDAVNSSEWYLSGHKLCNYLLLLDASSAFGLDAVQSTHKHKHSTHDSLSVKSVSSNMLRLPTLSPMETKTLQDVIAETISSNGENAGRIGEPSPTQKCPYKE